MSIPNMFNHGHIYGTTPDGRYEDIDVNIPDYWFKDKYGIQIPIDAYDADGSEHSYISHDGDVVTFKLECYSREWDFNGKSISFDSADFIIEALVTPDDEGSYEYGTLSNIVIKSVTLNNFVEE